jgi:hypothetical protein
MSKRAEFFVFAFFAEQIFFTELAFVSTWVIKLFDFIVRKWTFIKILTIGVFTLDVLI